MTEFSKPTRPWERSAAAALLCLLGPAVSLTAIGCQDGPMYALKRANPFFTRQWARDEALGVTDHTRRADLLTLANSIETMPEDRQQYWSEHLDQIVEHDPSAEMRRLAVLAAGKSTDAKALSIIQAGLDDESIKVRMEACRALGNRRDESAANLLAQTLGKSQNKDVRHAAIEALAQHPGPVANNALKMALKDRDPATQTLVLGSLRQSTGMDLGDDPEVWIAALQSNGENASVPSLY